ncbi:hypothetical protein ACJMQP_04050 [Rhodopseudomonas palustris]
MPYSTLSALTFALAMLALALTLAGCDQRPGEREITDSPTGGTARFMGTVDGCRLWSVGGGTFYFANCGASSSGGRWTGGKGNHFIATTTDSTK